jgi:hypothetical protein
MSIPPFEREIEILDFDFFIRSRLNQAIVIWPEQAIALVGYMGWPNDPEGRAASVAILRRWAEGSRVIPTRLRQIQTDWPRVADIFSLHLDPPKEVTNGGAAAQVSARPSLLRLAAFGLRAPEQQTFGELGRNTRTLPTLSRPQRSSVLRSGNERKSIHSVNLVSMATAFLRLRLR